MTKVASLEYVDASVLPAKVLVLLSKYAKVVRDTDGVLIRISSLNVFRHVHRSFKNTSSNRVHKLYNALLKEVNLHLANQDMYTIMSRPSPGYSSKTTKTQKGGFLSRSSKMVSPEPTVTIANEWQA